MIIYWRIRYRALMKTQYTKHLILGGLINGKLYGPNTLVEIAEMDDLQTGKIIQLRFKTNMEQEP